MGTVRREERKMVPGVGPECKAAPPVWGQADGEEKRPQKPCWLLSIVRLPQLVYK